MNYIVNFNIYIFYNILSADLLWSTISLFSTFIKRLYCIHTRNFDYNTNKTSLK